MATFSESTESKGSDVLKDFCCSTCQDQKLEEIAEFYCKECIKFYCRKCFNYHGQLFKSHSPYGRGEMKMWPVSKEVEDFLQKCELHKDKKLEMFCEDHDQLCCTTCAFLHHRQCTNVTLISESVEAQATNLQQLSDQIQTVLEQMAIRQNNWEATIKTLQGSFNEQLHKIQETRQNINATLDDIEKITLMEMKNTLSRLQNSCKSDVNNCRRLRDELKCLHEAIQDISDTSMKDLSFIASKKSLNKIQQSESFLNENSVQVERSLTFQPNSGIVQYLSKLSGLGRIVVSNQTLTVQGKSEYCVQISSDTSACGVTAICVLPDGQIIVADYNKKVKLLDQQYQVIAYLDLSADPQDMCQITPREIAVTVGCEVQFISHDNVQLVKGRKLQLQHKCYGIAHHEEDLYVTSTSALYKYTMSGKLVSKIYEENKRTSSSFVTVNKCAITPRGDRIYITNPDQHKLLTLARDGSVLATFTDPELQRPDGIHVTPEGQVLVCGWYSHTVIQVESEGRKKLATLATSKDGLRSPESVCYNSYTGSIIVGQKNNNILVFKVQ